MAPLLFFCKDFGASSIIMKLALILPFALDREGPPKNSIQSSSLISRRNTSDGGSTVRGARRIHFHETYLA
jgi:hypothetical protein